jgi:hypothetical protein
MRRSWRVLLVWIMMASLLGVRPTGPILAAGTVGNGTPGSCTEGALTTALAGGGLVTFNCGPAALTITLMNQKVIEDDTQIDGGGLVTLSGGNAVRIFVVMSGVTLELANITLSDGNVGAASGGAIHNSGTLLITNSALSGNGAAFEGGAISNFGTLTITNSTLNGNASNDEGGAIFNSVGGTLDITNSTLNDNDGSNEGGAISNEGSLAITDSAFSGNIAVNGGAILSFSMLDATNSTFSNNSAENGGAIYNAFGGTLDITNSTLGGNLANILGGGAIYNATGGTLTITDSTLSNNNATFGGAIFNQPGGMVEITNSTFNGNSALEGGANYNSGTLELTNSTLSSNSAGNGGAIVNEGTLTITNSTFSGNGADGSGGAILHADPNNLDSTTIAASIVALNSAGSSGPNCFVLSGTITSQGSNLSDDDSCAFTGLGDIQNSPTVNLGPLANNGGPTRTMLPQPGSDAIDNSACLTNQDQRGVIRPQGAACDIGAVERGRTSTFPLCVSLYTGIVSSPPGGCGAGQVALSVPASLSFCIEPYTGRVLYLFGRPCQPPRRAHVLPDQGDLLTCVSLYTRVNRWVLHHGQCLATEVANTIPATP